MKQRIVLFLVLLVMTGAVGTAMAFTPDENAYLDYQSRVLELVNEERASANLPLLRMAKPEAIRVAMYRAYEISIRFTHTRPNGSGVQTLLYDYGVRFRRYGENLAYGYDSAASVMNGWMRSQSHKANIMQKEFTMLAVGVYRTNGTRYWVQIFLAD
ncbi:hypothetical protein AGMMS49992_02380 [Clostridia bacterium]|nr:hypothetical protein AGMMS49992_02380 [Clostridia bacterium]